MAHKEMNYIKGYAKGKGYFELLKAINCATLLHEGQYRKSGEPYIDHPMRVCSSLIALGVDDELILVSAILHDVVEDCNIALMDLHHNYGISKESIDLISYLTKVDGFPTDFYYGQIKLNFRSSLVKIADRCHNVSTMAGAFTREKIADYINETNEYVLPLCKHVIRFYPEYSDAVYAMKYQIESIIKALKVTLLLEN